MTRAPSTFRKRDVKAAVEATKAAGVNVRRVEIDRNGKITIVAGKPDADTTDENPWDGVLTDATH